MSAFLHSDDTISVDDVIDLNQDYLGEDILSEKEYRISLRSIDDDELRQFHRNLVTPAASVCCSDDDNLSKNMVRQRFVPPSRVQRPPSRGESVMLFKKINNGDEDVTSFDLVSSDLRDFIDTDFMMEGMLSRPVSRTTIVQNASKIQDINRFRSSFIERPKEAMKSPLMNSNSSSSINRKKLPNTPTHSKSRLYLSKSQEQPLSSVSELLTKANHRYIDRQRPSQSSPSSTRDEFYKQIPRRVTNSLQDTKKQQHDILVETSRTSAGRSNGREPEYYQHQATPLTVRKPGFSIPNHHHYSMYSRNRSDITTISSSSDEEPVEEYGTSTKFVIPQHRSSFSAVEPRMKHYYDSTEMHSKSSPRLRTMSSHKTFPIRNYYSTATTTTVTEDEAVTDSAKQVLACIRERRKSSLLAADHSPKVASSTRLINSSASDKPRLYYKSSNNRRIDSSSSAVAAIASVGTIATTTRLPQRTLYR